MCRAAVAFAFFVISCRAECGLEACNDEPDSLRVSMLQSRKELALTEKLANPGAVQAHKLDTEASVNRKSEIVEELRRIDKELAELRNAHGNKAAAERKAQILSEMKDIDEELVRLQHTRLVEEGKHASDGPAQKHAGRLGRELDIAFLGKGCHCGDAKDEHSCQGKCQNARAPYPPQCATDWGIFKDTSVLDTTQSVQPQGAMPASFSSFDHGSPYQGLYVNPSLNFAFCTIEKNACKAWNLLFTKLNKNSPNSSFPDWTVTHTSLEDAGPQAVEQIFANPSSTRAVIVRDPLARFASAFFDKCVPMEKYGICKPTGYCLIDTGTAEHPKAVTFESVLNAMLDSDPRTLDGHWKLQSEHCELRSRAHEYSVIGLMKKDTLAADATCIMDIAGMSEFNNDGSGHRFWHIPEESNSHIVHADPQSEERVLKKLFTRETARALIAHLKQDYDTFHFVQEPDWLEEATGEWQTYLPPPCRTRDADGDGLPHTSPVSLLQNVHDALMDDDIVEMARRKGFQSPVL